MPDGDDRSPATDAAAEPHVNVVVFTDYCVRHRGADCDRCAVACPHDAITFSADDKPEVDAASCNGCGVCYGICDAFGSTRLTLADLHARIRRIAVSGQRAFLTCRENVFPGFTPAENVVVLPCLSMVPPQLWTVVLAENIRISIAGDLGYCENCERAGAVGGMLYPHAISEAEAATGGQVGYAEHAPEAHTLLDKYTDDADPLGRRAMFTGIATDFGDIATGKRRLRESEVLQDFHERRERQRAAARLQLHDVDIFNDFLPKGHMRRTLFPRQRMVLESVARMPEAAERMDVTISATEQELCDRCQACVTTCPTGARCPDDGGVIEVEARYCVGCGACVNVCPTGAARLISTDATAFGVAPLEEGNGDETRR